MKIEFEKSIINFENQMINNEKCSFNKILFRNYCPIEISNKNKNYVVNNAIWMYKFENNSKYSLECELSIQNDYFEIHLRKSN